MHNDAAVLRDCIESVLAQTYSSWEYAIVDNASTDGTPELAQEYARRDERVRHVRFDDLVDVNSSYNRAVRAISPASEYCKVVGADDRLFPACLARMVDLAETSDGIGLVGAYRQAGDEVDLTGLDSQTVVDGRTILRAQLLESLSVIGGPSSFLLRSRLVREHDPFFDHRFVHPDTEAVYRILTGHSFGFVPEVLTFARRDPGRGLSRALEINTRDAEQLRFVLRFGASVFSPEDYRRQVRRRLWNYALWHTRQLWQRSWRVRERDFFATHRFETEAMLGEGGDDLEVRAVVGYVRFLLARGGARSHNAPRSDQLRGLSTGPAPPHASRESRGAPEGDPAEQAAGA